MDFDLEFWLVSATAITGIIWLLYALLAGEKRKLKSLYWWSMHVPFFQYY